MSKLERLPKRPPAIARRASGPSLCSDPGSSGGGASGEYASSNINALISPALPLSDRSNRGAILSEEGHDSSTGLSLAYRSAALTSGHGGMKMARSASSSVTPSTDMSLVHNIHSTASTASPLITPSDDAHLQDPLLAATSHGSLFELKQQRRDHTPAVYDGKQAQAPATSMESAKESSVSSKQRQAQHRPKPQDRDRSAGGGSSPTTKGSEAGEKAWSEVTSTPASWADSSMLLPLSPESAAQTKARPRRQPEEQRNDRAGSSHRENNVSGKLRLEQEWEQFIDAAVRERQYIDQELSLLAQGMSMEQSPKPVLPSRSSTARPTDPHKAHEGINPAQYHDSSPTALSSLSSAQQSAYPLHQPLPPTYHRESMPPQCAAYVANRGGGPEALTNAYNRTAGMEPVPFEAFRSTPDPYAPMYGLPPPSISSTSTPHSPTFGNHHHQLSSDSAIFMYPGSYPQALPSIPSQRLQHVIPANPQDITTGTHMGNGRLPSGVAAPMMVQGVHSYGPQSPIMMTTAPSHLQQANRRDVNLPHQGGMPVMDPGFTASSQWPNSPSNYTHHAHSPTLSGHYDVRPAMGMSGVVPSTGGGGHHRVLSTHQAFPVSAMMFAPGSISPPSPFIRAQGQGRMGMHSRSPSSFSQFSQQRSAGSDAQRSPLLEDFRSRNNKGRHFELSDIRGHLLEFSSDQYGSRFAQEKLDTATEEERQMVFDELFPHSLTLMTDVFGNYVIQKLFQHGTDDMRLRLVNQLEGHVLTLSLGTYGCRVVQRALEYIKNADQIRIANELRLDILTCARDQNANHVIQKILERISPTSQIDFIPLAFRGNVYTLAAHCYSCRVLQRIFQHCDEAQHRPLIDELLGKAEELMHDQYGNYVIQWILQNASKPDQDVVIRLAKGNVMRLSRHKFASNVMEQVVRAASQEERYSLIEESLVPMQDGNSHDLQPGAILMMKDQYANYVLQRFLELSDGLQKARLISVVKPALHNMKRFSNGFAKHLSAIERLLDTTVTRSNAATMTSTSNVGHEGRPTI